MQDSFLFIREIYLSIINSSILINNFQRSLLPHFHGLLHLKWIFRRRLIPLWKLSLCSPRHFLFLKIKSLVLISRSRNFVSQRLLSYSFLRRKSFWLLHWMRSWKPWVMLKQVSRFDFVTYFVNIIDVLNDFRFVDVRQRLRNLILLNTWALRRLVNCYHYSTLTLYGSVKKL